MPTKQVIVAAAAAAALVPLASAGGFPPLRGASFLLEDNGAECYFSDGRAGEQGHESLEFGFAAGTTPHIRDIVCRGGERLNTRGYPHKIPLKRLDSSAFSGPLNELNAAATRMNPRRLPDVKRLVTFGKPTYIPKYDLRTYTSGSETVEKSVNACRAAAEALEKAYGSLEKLCKEVF
ncbi:hypothetical protein FOZ63_009572 [Perkinsus olseni]|uniref:Uncharacterized protein n=1 Tax=Perkinsus olseni TaxID=32597 RepID=A0A7J6T7C8_PEROL|nr:hypothetical protein FOZ62_030215 [Perkinsus olseni]KAF4741164.1 hypothetical protein FOZ63_009572 [Perkinsus olseni]